MTVLTGEILNAVAVVVVACAGPATTRRAACWCGIACSWRAWTSARP